MSTVNLHFKFPINKEFNIEATSFQDIIGFINLYFPDYMDYIGLYTNRLITTEEYNLPVPKTVYALILATGNASNIRYFNVRNQTTQSMEAGGLERRIKDTVLTQNVNIDSESRDRFKFNPIKYTVNVNSPIPLIYGLTRVAGQIINGFTKTFQRGQEDNIDLRDIT